MTQTTVHIIQTRRDAWTRHVNIMEPSHDPPPPPPPPCIYDSRLHYPLQCVYLYLSVRDLCRLARVSKKFYYDVERLYEILCKSLSLERSVQLFFQHQLILKDDYSALKMLQAQRYRYNWLFMKWLKLRRVYRKSVAQFHIAPTENPSYITREYDDNLDREIVRIIKLRWIYFAHKFCGISPGFYRAVLRMDIVDVPWLDRYASATIRTSWTDSRGYHEKMTEIHASEWQGLCDSLKTLEPGKCISLRGALLANYDPDSGWFDLCLEAFQLVEHSDVTFEFKDILNFWWVSGMRWDYVEIKPIDWLDHQPIDVIYYPDW